LHALDPKRSRVAARGSALVEACAGLLAFAAAAAALQVVAPGREALAPAAQTPAPSAPPARIGSDFDDDRRMPVRARRLASYSLRVTLDTSSHQLRGSGVIQWTNGSVSSVRELWLHLYMNAFKNDQTLFLRSPYGTGRSGERAHSYGYIDVQKLSARELGGRDLWPSADRHSPSEPGDQTDIRVPLPEAVTPGGQLTLDVEFVVQLPQIVERTGHSGSFHFVAQWFPKLVRLEPDGSWAHFPFHAQSEFYADFGDYDVELNVPDGFVVGATGQRVEERAAQGRRTLRYQAQNVHDFAWTAWDGFLERRDTVAGVAVRLLHPPGHEATVERTLEAIRFGLPHFNRRYGRYPYPVLTVVHPPRAGRSAGGMEYPTLITTGGAWYYPLIGVRALESVTLHELAHQWFYGLVATNEHQWPFLDEGLTSYAEVHALEAAYSHSSLVALPGFGVSMQSGHRALAAGRAKDEAIAAAAARFENFSALGALVYSRTATVLSTFANVYGEANMARALGRYARHYRFDHPSPKHLVAALRETLGDDAARALEKALFERGTIDYVVSEVVSTRARPPSGVFDRDTGRETLLPNQDALGGDWLGRVAIYRYGELELPVQIDLIASDGSRQRRHWDGRGTWTALHYRGKSRLVAARVDPERRILLDDDLFNNARSTGTEHTPRVLERATYWTELLFAVFGP
jgi:hypothetical protein